MTFTDFVLYDLVADNRHSSIQGVNSEIYHYHTRDLREEVLNTKKTVGKGLPGVGRGL
jgi:hypothetical protein